MERSSIAGILLAAGLSRRYGAGSKLLVPFRGQPLVLHAAQTLRRLGLGRYVAVCGTNDRLAPLLDAEGFEVVINPTPEVGLSSSLVVGVASVQTAEAALICLGDMPLVPVSHLAALLASLTLTSMVASEAEDGRRSPPAAFSKEHFGALLAATGDSGARPLIQAAETVRTTNAQLRDFDTPADFIGLERLNEIYASCRGAGVPVP